MSIKTVLDDFSKNEEERIQRMQADEERARTDIEAMQERLTQCFEKIILPGIYSVENDLVQAGYWHRIQITQSTSPETGRQHVRDVMFYFYPEKTQNPIYSQKVMDVAYKTVISATSDSRKISFAIHFPRRLPPVIETDETLHRPETITQNTVDRFLEKFIKGAIDVYQSDRVLV
jgi:hypothetical protein